MKCFIQRMDRLSYAIMPLAEWKYFYLHFFITFWMLEINWILYEHKSVQYIHTQKWRWSWCVQFCNLIKLTFNNIFNLINLLNAILDWYQSHDYYYNIYIVCITCAHHQRHHFSKYSRKLIKSDQIVVLIFRGRVCECGRMRAKY